MIGGFADGGWTNLRGDHGLFGIFRGEQSMRWSWAVGGRVGYLVTPSLLAYVSGGYTEAEFGGINLCTGGVPQPIGQTGLAERQHTTVQTFRTELVWRFNWGGPSVVAKY